MGTWEDLDNELESDEEDAEDEAKIAMALVATVENDKESSDVESCADSESETEVYSKLSRFELIDSIKELLGHYENWWAKPQVYGFTEVAKREYRSNMELFNLIYF